MILFVFGGGVGEDLCVLVGMGCFGATKSIDLGGSPTSRKARREQKPQPVVNGFVG